MERRILDRPGPAAALLLLLATAAVGCGRAPAHDPTPRAEGSAVAVDVVAPDSAVLRSVVLPARVKALEEVSVAARLSGRVGILHVREGERVRAGQPLARFDAPESRRALEAARREAAAARVRLATTSRQMSRVDSLVSRGVASERDRETTEVDHRDAEARLAAAESAVETLDAALAPRAPLSGVIARRYLDEGAEVAPGTPLFDVRSNDGVEIVSAVPESALPGIVGGRWEVETEPGSWHSATLERIDGMTDPATRSRGVRLRLEVARALEPGAFARVRLITSERRADVAWRLPHSAIVRRGALRGAFVIADDRAELRWLQLGREEPGGVEVLAGLAADERVARTAAGLADGARVRVRP
jgi:RND family efflux transporter MFP subunit